MVKFITTIADFELELKAASQKGSLIVIYFSVNWCGPIRVEVGPCRMIEFDAMSKEEGFSGVIFVQVDVAEAKELVAKCGVQTMPTFQFFKGGEEVDEVKGAYEGQLRAKIEAYK